MNKKLSIVALTFLLSATSVLAQLPQSIWTPLNAYTAAKEANDTAGIIKHAEQMIAIMEQQPASQSKTEILGARYDELARLYEKQGNYTKAQAYYEKYLPYGEAMGWTDGVSYAKQKINLLTTTLEVYQTVNAPTAPYYGAKFEPKTGVYYGTVYDKDPAIGIGYSNEAIRDKYPSEESLLLTYLEFGHNIERVERYFELAKEEGKAILLAWNTYGSTFDTMHYANSKPADVQAYIDETLNYIEASGVPVFLRFANEMNVGENGDNATSYVETFRAVATKAKAKENIAMVWSPNDVGAVDRPFEKYYPGDAYVDWIGLSMYPVQYFGGKDDTNPRTKDNNDTFFLAGPNANPLLRVEPVIDFMKANNINKPIMITECGMHHQVKTLGKDTSAWANYQLQKTYSEMIRLYPQIKGICYFNTEVNGIANDYALFNNETMLNTYNKYVAEPIFIKEMGVESGMSYKALPDQSVMVRPTEAITLSAAAYYPFINQPGQMSVEYRIDGKWMAAPSTPPYSTTFTPEQLSGAKHITIKLVVNGQAVATKQINIQ